MRTAGEVLHALVRCLGIAVIEAGHSTVYHALPDADRTTSIGNGPCRPGRVSSWSTSSHRRKSPMPMPPPVVRGRSLCRAAEALQEGVKDAHRESGGGMTVGRRAEPQVRQMG